MKVQIIMPMAGNAARFNRNTEAHIIKPLIEIKNRKLYEWAISSFKELTVSFFTVFIIQKSHLELGNHIRKFKPEAKILEIDQNTRGPVDTIRYAFDCIEDNLPVIICDCDLFFKSSELNTFLNSPVSKENIGILSFKSKLPQYSYVQEVNRQITDIKEKVVISENAVCGCYCFPTGAILKSLITDTFNDIKERELFLSDVIKMSLTKGLKAKVLICDEHVSLGTPEELQQNSKRLPLDSREY